MERLMSDETTDEQLIFSFVVPAYNEEIHIEKTLRAIHAAFEPDRRQEHEIVLIDNGSDDRTVEIAESMDSRTFVKPDMGISELRNFGASVASGRILVFIDADVSLTPTWRTDVAPYLPRLLGGNREIVGSHYQPNPDTPYPLICWFIGQYQNPRTTFLPGGHTIVTRDAFDEIGGFDPEFGTSEDIDFCHRATASGFDVKNCPDIGVIHMGDPNSVRQFLKRECWHGGSDFESIGRMLTSRTAWATVFFLVAHLALAYFLIRGNAVGALGSLVVIAGQAVATSQHLFPRSSVRLRLVNSLNAYIYFLGRICSIKTLFRESRRD